jgi:hypothetical protein
VWYQPPNHFIDPQLFSPAPAPPATPCANSQNSSTVTPSRVFGSDITSMVNEVPASQLPQAPTPGIKNTPVQTPARPPKSSTFSKDILDKARASIQAVPKKRTLGETLMDIQRYAQSVLSLSILFSHLRHRENVAALREESQQKLMMSKRQQLLEEFKLGIWTKEQYVQQVLALEGGVSDVAHPSKCQRTREYSPDWDIEGDLSGLLHDSDDA